MRRSIVLALVASWRVRRLNDSARVSVDPMYALCASSKCFSSASTAASRENFNALYSSLVAIFDLLPLVSNAASASCSRALVRLLHRAHQLQEVPSLTLVRG